MNLAHEHKILTPEFSHGMKKKLALAAALIPNPELLFLDEPFEGVDAVASRTSPIACATGPWLRSAGLCLHPRCSRSPSSASGRE